MYLLSLLIILIIIGEIKSVITNNNTLYEILSLKDLKIDYIVKLLLWIFNLLILLNLFAFQYYDY